MADGKLTGEAGTKLTEKLKERGFLVYYDHGDPKNEFVGNIYVCINNKVNRDTQISQLDIAIVRKEDHKAVALIEIEETSSSPKTIVGDIFTFLLGDTVKFGMKGKAIEVTDKTIFLVLVQGKGKQERLELFTDKAMVARESIHTINSKVDSIQIKHFSDTDEMVELILEQVELYN